MPETVEIMRSAEALTGKGIEVVPDRSISTRATIRIARENDAAHVVRYQPQFDKELPYLVSHECGHLIRIYEAPPEHRKLPATTRAHRRRVAYELKRDLKKLSKKGLPDAALGQLLAMWHDGLVRQVANTPVDMRIERWLRDSYLGLKEYQELSLKRQLEANSQVLQPRVRDFTPAKVYDASVTMNAAYARYISMLLDDQRLKGQYRGSKYEETGRPLAEAIWESEDRGYAGDIEEANRWAKLFGIEDWFGWRGLVPGGDLSGP